ncbi:TAXI family TRAP transporter solute-binding subunit [Halomonas campaniensis]|uniref:C4-dicarboxylate ABC transporter substrate-binding protein n=1 Tax=Halomonas campaniensis TaxID=213554 RepID=A0A246S3X7_9GAMM|nr:TAXI family TRAP transporter solute-binding subunit [Halomonas campaniensis]OWV31165.1 C4-dicarboxylate ABC transporter substrate-binding protein [Halomonas campaniensis]
MNKITLAITATAFAFSSASMAADNQSDWPSSMTVGTASQGGTYYIYGSGWANLINQKLDTNIGAEITGGPMQNVSMVQMGEHDFGLVTLGPAREALEGKSPIMPGIEHDNVRAVFPMYPTIFHITALQSSEISSVDDLVGKRVGVGPAGGTNSVYFPRFFDLLGYDVDTLEGGAGDQTGQMQDGLLDAFAFGAGLPVSAVSQVEAQSAVNVFSYSEAEIDTIVEAYPEISTAVIPADTYNSMDEDLPTVSMWNFVVTSADMPESLVYEIVKTVMENNDAMQQIHRSAEETLPENYIHNTQIPFHPGAVRWFEENGYDIPEELEG